MNDYIIKKLTELLIEQDIKDKQIGNRELISKVEAYKGLIRFFKEIKNEKNISNNIAYTDVSEC